MRWSCICHAIVLSAAVTVQARPAQHERRALASFFDSLVHWAFDGVTRRYLYGMGKHDLSLLDDVVLNFASYANWTENGWLLRVHGNVHKNPPFRQGVVDRAINILLLGQSLDGDETRMAKHAAEDILVCPQRGKYPAFDLSPAPPRAQPGDPNGSRDIIDTYSMQHLQLVEATIKEGDFDERVRIKTIGFAAGHTTKSLQKVNLVSSNNATGGNTTSYLVPPTGLTVVSDVDDILRIARVWKPREAVLNAFARPYVPWMNMPEIYKGWKERMPEAHFHYFSVAHEYTTRPYVEFLYDHYPEGSYDTRPMNISNWHQTMHVREYFLKVIFESFPKRRFVLVGDTSNTDVLKAYPLMANLFPSQIHCIFLRNVSATDDSIHTTPDFGELKKVDPQKLMIFNVPDDLHGLDILDGQCINDTVAQPKTFERHHWWQTWKEKLTFFFCIFSKDC